MPENQVTKTNILNFDKVGLNSYLSNLGETSNYRASQIIAWLHKYGCNDFDLMTNLAKKLRFKLANNTVISAPSIVSEAISNDGTIKWLMSVGNGALIETVYIPETTRNTLCVSSQIGCMLNCSFCSTATQGFNRNLSTSEIIGQLWQANNRLKELYEDTRVTNVVMMGMGEPLLNYNAVIPAMRIMLDADAYGMSRKKVTISTSGVVPAIYDLTNDVNVALAISLHAPNDKLRDELVPINRKYPISELIASCKHYLSNKSPKDKITIEYVMLDGVNDTLEHAKQLRKVLAHLPSKINLIPFNTFPGTKYNTSKRENIVKFQRSLMEAGFFTTVRKTRGDDIFGACGQLVGDFKDKTKRRERLRNTDIVVN